MTEAESCDVYSTLLNISVDIPGFLHDLDSLKASMLSNKLERAALAVNLRQTLISLQRWWNASFSVRGVAESSPGYNLLNASAAAFHHMVLLLVEELCHLLEVSWLHVTPLSCRFTLGLMSASGTTGRAQRKHILASEILNLAKRSISGDTAIYGVLAFIMPLHVAHDNLLPESPEKGHIGHLMNTVMAGQHGFRMAQQHQGMYKPFQDASY